MNTSNRSAFLSRLRLSYRAELRWMLAPYALGALLLVIVPALLTGGLAFFRYDALSAPVWYGTLNFRRILADPRLPIILNNSLLFIALAVPARVLGALALALLLRAPGLRIYRAAVLLPTLIPDVAYALIGLWFFNPLYGPLNALLAALGWPTPAWLTQANTARLALAVLAAFQLGEGFLVVLAGLRAIPPDYYAAASLDGASGWQQFWHLTWPLLRPWLILLTLRDVLLTFQNTFTPARLMTGGDPYYATFFLPMLAYEEAVDGFRFGMSAVVMLMILLVTSLLLLLVWGVFQGWGYADEV